MKLIFIPLLFIIILAISVQSINFVPYGYENIEDSFDNPAKFSNGTYGQEIQQLEMMQANFNLTLELGFITFFIAIIAVGIIAGLNVSVLGSTVQISERSQKLVYNSMFYGGLWGIFSVLATIGIRGYGLFSIPVYGVLFYLILTLVYVLGVNQQIEGTG